MYHLRVFDLATTSEESELSLETSSSLSDKAPLPSSMHLNVNHALFHTGTPYYDGLYNDTDYVSIAPVALHETLQFQWKIDRRMRSEETVLERDATAHRHANGIGLVDCVDSLIQQWILSPALLCFAFSSNRQYPKVTEVYLRALASGGYGYSMIEFWNPLLLDACNMPDDLESILYFFALGLPNDVLPRQHLPVVMIKMVLIPHFVPGRPIALNHGPCHEASSQGIYVGTTFVDAIPFLHAYFWALIIDASNDNDYASPVNATTTIVGSTNTASICSRRQTTRLSQAKPIPLPLLGACLVAYHCLFFRPSSSFSFFRDCNPF